MQIEYLMHCVIQLQDRASLCPTNSYGHMDIWDHNLRVASHRMEEQEIKLGTPGYKASGLSITSLRLLFSNRKWYAKVQDSWAWTPLVTNFVVNGFWSTSELRVRLARCETGLSPPVKYFYWPFFCGSFVLFMSCICHSFASVHCCAVVTWRERADLLALVCDVYCDFVTFPFGILGQVCFFVWFDSLRPINYLSVIKGCFFLG